jgi:hypothetical protein
MPGNRPDEPGASSLFAGQRCSGKIVTISNRILFLGFKRSEAKFELAMCLFAKQTYGTAH